MFWIGVASATTRITVSCNPRGQNYTEAKS